MTSWPELLDALEERTRRIEAAIEDDDGDSEPVPEVALRADGPLPADLASRVRLLLAKTEQLEAGALRRQDELNRAMRYVQA